MDEYPELLPGDIAGVRGRGLLRWLSEHLTTPWTDRIHFFIIGDYLPWDDDYVILESINKGVTVGRLSFYKPEDLEIYRVQLPDKTGNPDAELLVRQKAAAAMTRLGRASYDFLLYVHLFAGALNLLVHGKLPPYDPAQLPYGRNGAYICTEAANYGWRYVGHPVIPPGVVPTPAGFEKALIEGRTKRIFPEVEP